MIGAKPLQLGKGKRGSEPPLWKRHKTSHYYLDLFLLQSKHFKIPSEGWAGNIITLTIQ